MNLKLFTTTLLFSFPLSACPPTQTRTGPVVIDRNELQNFADAFFAEQMKTLHIPGVVVVFVQKGEAIFAKGYGYADLEHAIPLDPDSSIMRIGSISKPFVATAVMQLVEQGKLDLRTDVNLGFFFAFNEECLQTSACDLIPAFRTQFMAKFLNN